MKSILSWWLLLTVSGATATLGWHLKPSPRPEPVGPSITGTLLLQQSNDGGQTWSTIGRGDYPFGFDTLETPALLGATHVRLYWRTAK
jgi:hypothetical protein